MAKRAPAMPDTGENPAGAMQQTHETYEDFRSAEGGLRKQRGTAIEAFLKVQPKKGTFAHVRWQVGTFMEWVPCRIFFIVLVGLNAIQIGIEADWTNDSNEATFDLIEMIFLGFFTVEVGLKLFGFGLLFFTDEWNNADGLIVGLSIVEVIMERIGNYESSGASAVRLIRVFRIIRLVGFLERLNLLVKAFFMALKSVVWVGVLILLLVYVFAILAQGFFGANEPLTRNVANGEYGVDVYDLFGTVPRSMVTLVQIMTFDSWMSGITRPIADEAPAAWVFFIVFALVAALGLLNLLTAVFIDALTELSNEDAARSAKAKQEWMEKLENGAGELFQVLDADGNGFLTKDELDKAIVDAEDASKSEDQTQIKLRALFSDLGVELEFVRQAVEAFDTDEDGTLIVDEFVQAIAYLDEPTSKRDIWVIERRVKSLEKRLRCLNEEVESKLGQVVTKLKGGGW